MPRPVVGEDGRRHAEKETRSGEGGPASLRGHDRRGTVKEPSEEHRQAERRRDVRPVVVDHFGEGCEGRFRRKGDEKPERCKRDLRITPGCAEGEDGPGQEY